MTNAVREADGRTGLYAPDLGFSVARFTGSVPWNAPFPALKCWAIFKSSALRTLMTSCFMN